MPSNCDSTRAQADGDELCSRRQPTPSGHSTTNSPQSPPNTVGGTQELFPRDSGSRTYSALSPPNYPHSTASGSGSARLANNTISSADTLPRDSRTLEPRWTKVKRQVQSFADHLQNLWTKTKASFQILLDYLQDSWFLEVVACIFAASLFGTEIGILVAFDKQATESWPWQWSLNSAVALLTTLIESSLLFAIVSCLGQMKWLWFSSDQTNRKRLIWIDFLARSNTPVGALSLLLFHATTWKNFLRMPVWLGASCIVALLGTGLFSQNVITRRFMNIDDPFGGMINVARLYDHWTWGTSGETLGDQGPGTQMSSYATFGFAYANNVIMGFSTYPYDDLSLNGQFGCDSQNCTFEPYDTLSICAQCEDISNEVTVESGRFMLRSGVLSLEVENGAVNISSDTNYPRWDHGDTPGPLLVHYLAMVHDADYEVRPAAVECVAYWCVATLQSYVLNGVLFEMPGNIDPSEDDSEYSLNDDAVTNHSDSARTSYGQEQDIYIRPETCQFNRTIFEDDENCTFRVTATTQIGLQNFLSEGYAGNPPFLNGSQEFISEPHAWRPTSFAAKAIHSVCLSGGDEGCQERMTEGIMTSFTNMTAFMNNVVRKTPSDDSPIGVPISFGTSYETIQVYHIRWYWILYPGIVVALVCGFVAATLWRSRNTHLWKTSILPALFHSLREVEETELARLAFPAAMRRRAEELLAELQELNDVGGETGRWQWRTQRENDV